MYPFNNQTISNQKGVTLVELIIAMVIISIAAVAILQTLGSQTVRNVDPMIQSQAQMLARQFLEEVTGKSFFDGSADPRLNSGLSRTQINNSVVDQSRAGAPSRVAWDNIYEYDGYTQSGLQDVYGNALTEFSNFSVDIEVDISSTVSINGDSNSATANCPPKYMAITVTITDPRGNNTALSGYRARYWQSPSSWGC
ncbi:type II secretion system GspH family protein [Reinekea forsetii]|nr:type II secretion system GspH family protein [Reinekea forsetii]